jgi:hypothetical protein
VNAAQHDALDVLDALTDREFGFIASLVRPRGITRERYREHIRSGHFDPDVFLANVHVMRVVAPRAWGLRVVR